MTDLQINEREGVYLWGLKATTIIDVGNVASRKGERAAHYDQQSCLTFRDLQVDG